MTNTQNHDESPGWEWESFAIACFVVIALSTLVGLIALPKKEGENLSLSFWALTIPFTISFSVVGCWLLDPREGCPLEDKKPNSATGNSEARREARADDPQVHTHAILDTSFDEKLAIVTKDVAEIAQRVGALDMALVKRVRPLQTKATTVREKEQQARYALIARLSDLGTETSPIDALQGAIQICSDTRLWEHPARAATVHIDTQRLYNEGKIWPSIRDHHIVWSLDPDYDPPDETDEIEQTPFCPFRCCSRCKYIGKYYDCCAVVPFGCGTGNPSEQCREFEREDGGTPIPELTIDDVPF